MSNEDPNNTPRWRNKLDDLEHLPGSAFNRDATWDKLYGRFQGNKKSKKIFWYWIAAACLLLGLMITILNYQQTTPQASAKETAIKQAKEIKKPVLKAEEVNKNENENNLELIKNKIVTTSNKPIQRNRHIMHTGIVTKVQPGNVVINYPEKEPLVKPLQIINTNSTTAILPPKKKLNVVHINELGDPVIETSDITRIPDMHSFQLKFGNGEVLSNSPIASKSSGLIILKTKPTSN
jgi:hypothetical protein